MSGNISINLINPPGEKFRARAVALLEGVHLHILSKIPVMSSGTAFSEYLVGYAPLLKQSGAQNRCLMCERHLKLATSQRGFYP